MINNQNQNNIISQTNNQINVVGQQTDGSQFDKNIVQTPQNQNIKKINQINNITNLNNNPTPINNLINIPVNNNTNATGNNNILNLNTPINIPKNPITINTLLSNIKSPTSNNQPSQILMMNSPQINIQDINKGININPLPNISNIPNPNLQNINNINPLNFNNINNPSQYSQKYSRNSSFKSKYIAQYSRK